MVTEAEETTVQTEKVLFNMAVVVWGVRKYNQLSSQLEVGWDLGWAWPYLNNDKAVNLTKKSHQMARSLDLNV